MIQIEDKLDNQEKILKKENNNFLNAKRQKTCKLLKFLTSWHNENRKAENPINHEKNFFWKMK